MQCLDGIRWKRHLNRKNKNRKTFCISEKKANRTKETTTMNVTDIQNYLSETNTSSDSSADDTSDSSDASDTSSDSTADTASDSTADSISESTAE